MNENQQIFFLKENKTIGDFKTSMPNPNVNDFFFAVKKAFYNNRKSLPFSIHLLFFLHRFFLRDLIYLHIIYITFQSGC